MGEFELLARLRERLPAPAARLLVGSGDDAAVTLPEGATATSVDAMVEGVHFRRAWMSGAEIGRRALAVALSDLAAMGASPGEAYVALGVPEDLDEDGCLEIYQGLASLASEIGVSPAGGDLSRSPVLFISVTVVGHAGTAADLVLRGGARPGDVVVLTGEVGGAAAGLITLEQPELAGSLGDAPVGGLRARLLAPAPRLRAGAALARAGARAMIDISDGVGADAGHLAEAGSVRLEIDATRLPLGPGVEAVAEAAGLDAVRLAVSGGEDYELLAAVPPKRLADAARAVAEEGIALTVVGEVREGSGVAVSAGGHRLSPGGYDQLSRPATAD